MLKENYNKVIEVLADEWELLELSKLKSILRNLLLAFMKRLDFYW
ncbi:MAG: hypothetical protein V4489_01765 [Chlamydiota bacterium]